MPVNATINTLTEGTQTNDFQVSVSFDADISNFTISNIRFIGVAGYVSSVSSIPENLTSAMSWIVNINVAPNSYENIEFALLGNVTVNGIETEIVSSSITITIDTVIMPAFSLQSTQTAVYQSDGTIELPVNFGSNVLSFTRSDVSVTSSTTGFYDNFTHYVVGENTSYKIIFMPPMNSLGEFRVSIDGNVINASTLQGQTTSVSPITIQYNTTIPFVEDIDIPKNITTGIWDIYLAFNVKVTGLRTDSFIQNGINLSQPALYRWTGSGVFDVSTNAGKASTVPAAAYSNYDADDPNTHNSIDDFSSMVDNWKRLTSSSGPSGSPNEVSGNTAESRYFLLRFFISSNTQQGVYNVGLKDNAVQGPHLNV